MSEQPPRKATLIIDLVSLGLLAGTLIASACLWWLGDWENHAFALTLTLKILWGCWIVACLGTILTKVTIFGWSFRRYFRGWPEGWNPSTMFRRRPIRAPWAKSGKASFGFTVAMVSVTGVAALATAVMWILTDVTGDWVFWLVFKIVWASWWVAMIVLVLVRVAIFGQDKRRGMGDNGEPPPEQAPPQSPSGEPVTVPSRGEEP